MNTKHDLASVIIPVYNQDKYLPRCIESLTFQDYDNKELIFVNDASTDGSLDILRQSEALFPDFVKVVELDVNRGLGVARNIGFDASAGAYVAFVDADDWVDSTFLSAAIAALKETSCEIAALGVKNEYGSPRSSEIRFGFPSRNVISGAYALNLLCRQYNADIYVSSMVTNKVYKRCYLENTAMPFEETSYDNDVEFTFKLLCHPCNVALLPQPFYHYVQHEQSAMHLLSERTIRDQMHSFRRIRDHLESLGRFEELSDNYYALFDKCTTTMVDYLLSSNYSSDQKKHYLARFYKAALDLLDLPRIVETIDLERIRAFHGL